MSNYLLLKVSAIEQVSSNEPCRIAEDILTIICNEANAAAMPSPTPTITATPTPTPTPLNIFDTNITIAGTNSIIGTYSSNGLTFTSTGGAGLYFNKQPLSATIGVVSIRKGTPSNSTEIARIVFVDSYLNKSFRLSLGGINYSGVFMNDTIYLP
jgi:hypothetical protein